MDNVQTWDSYISILSSKPMDFIMHCYLSFSYLAAQVWVTDSAVKWFTNNETHILLSWSQSACPLSNHKLFRYDDLLSCK
jgi:hypothetical protein